MCRSILRRNPLLWAVKDEPGAKRILPHGQICIRVFVSWSPYIQNMPNLFAGCTGPASARCPHHLCQQGLRIGNWQHDVGAHTPGSGQTAAHCIPVWSQLCQRSYGQTAHWFCCSLKGLYFIPILNETHPPPSFFTRPPFLAHGFQGRVSLVVFSSFHSCQRKSMEG